MRAPYRFLIGGLLIALVAPALAAPDEDILGKAEGYPVGTPKTWFFDEHVRVGSFSHIDKVLPHYDTLHRSSSPLPLPKAVSAPNLGYRFEQQSYTIDDFLARRRITLGVYGQSILVDPELKLVLVLTAAARTANVGKETLGRERDALWRGLVASFGSW
jgi:CubicO group peptidase (beta-lactamase class C family)